MVAKKVKPIIVIVGPTASGKSNLAIKLAQRFNGEIVSADSWSIYREFNVGTAKPTLEQQKLIQHHLIDVANPVDGFSAAEFKRLASFAINDIFSRGKLPIVVGGTGLYIDSLIYDYSFLPAGEPTERARLNEMNLEDLLSLAESRNIDTSSIDERNKRRVIRLIENKGVKPSKSKLRPNTLLIGVNIDKVKLRQKLHTRTIKMFKEGLIEEVRNLSNKYGWNIEPMRGIGYREFKHYMTENNENIDVVAQKIINDSVALAKKQMTWFKRNNSIQWINNSDEAVEITTTFLNKYSN